MNFLYRNINLIQGSIIILLLSLFIFNIIGYELTVIIMFLTIISSIYIIKKKNIILNINELDIQYHQ